MVPQWKYVMILLQPIGRCFFELIGRCVLGKDGQITQQSKCVDLAGEDLVRQVEIMSHHEKPLVLHFSDLIFVLLEHAERAHVEDQQFDWHLYLWHEDVTKLGLEEGKVFAQVEPQEQAHGQPHVKRK